MMTASHESLRDDFEVSSAELNTIVEAAVETEGCFGARMTGGGFGGCTITMVHHDAVDGLRERVEAERRRIAQIFDSIPDEIVVLDVSATPQGRAHAVEVTRRIRDALSIPLTVGGGVRTADDAARLLDSGADKVAVNTAAVGDPALLDRLAEHRVEIG